MTIWNSESIGLMSLPWCHSRALIRALDWLTFMSQPYLSWCLVCSHSSFSWGRVVLCRVTGCLPWLPWAWLFQGKKDWGSRKICTRIWRLCLWEWLWAWDVIASVCFGFELIASIWFSSSTGNGDLAMVTHSAKCKCISAKVQYALTYA